MAALSAAEHKEWHDRIKRFTDEKGLGISDDNIDQLMQDSLRRGKTMAELLRRLEQKYGNPSRPQSAVPSGSRPPSRAAASPATAAPTAASPQPAPAANTPTAQPRPGSAFDTSPQAERARWRSLLLDFCEQEGLGQTESDVEDLLIEADTHGVAHAQVYERLAKKFRGYRAGAAAMEEAAAGGGAAAGGRSRPATPAVTLEAARSDPHFHRIARLLHYHRAFATRAEAEVNTAERIVAAAKEKSANPGAEVLARVKAIYGEEPPASWVPPSDEERAALLASSAVLKAQAEALEAASAAAAQKHKEEDDKMNKGAAKQKAPPSVAASKVSKRSAAATEALNLFPDDPEAATYFVRVRNYCRHHKLGQSDADVAGLIREQRTRGKPLDKIIKKLVDRFGPEPIPSPELKDMTKDLDRQHQFRRLSRLLQYYQMTPTVADINDILDTCDEKGRDYEYAVSKLITKYGPEPPADWVEAPLTSVPKTPRTPSRAPSARGSKRTGDRDGPASPSPRRSYDASPSARGGTTPKLAPTPASVEPLTMRALAFSRLKRYAYHNGWKRTDEDLHKMLDDAEKRSGGYEAMFARLVKSFGPEPRGPGVAGGFDITDKNEARLVAMDKLAVYCAHYNLQKTQQDMEKFLDDYENTVGWDEAFRRLERKFGPAPWADARTARGTNVTPSVAADAHWNTSAPSPEFAMDAVAAQRREVLRECNKLFKLGWSDSHITAMVERHSHDFDALLSALERSHGPLPEHVLNAVPASAKLTAGQLRRGGSNVAMSPLGAAGRQASPPTVNSFLDDIKPSRLKQRELPMPPGGMEDRERFRSEYAFWMDRVRNLFETHNPAYANDEDVDELLRQYVNRGLGFERMWAELVAKYGPEGPVKGKDSTRNYWKGKFKLYCEHYKMPKTDAELEQMMNDFEPKGWARMYDRLVELHGPPPALPATTAIPGIKMTPAQWRERLRNYCRSKFPTKSADEIDLYLDQFAEMSGGNLEALYATLVLLHGLERPADGDNTTREVSFATSNRTALSPGGAPGANGSSGVSAPTPNMDKMVREVAPPARDFYEGKSVVRVFLTVSGFDAGLYRGASPAHRQQLCTAVEQQIARAIGLGDNQCYLQAVCPDSASQTTFDVILSLTERHDASRVASQLVEMVANGDMNMDYIKRSVMEDLNGNPFAIRAKDITVSEVRSTAPPKLALSLDEQRHKALPLSSIELGNATVAYAPRGLPAGGSGDSGGIPFASHRPAAAVTASTTIQSPAAPPLNRASQGIHVQSARDPRPQFAESPLPADAPKPSRLKEILSTISDFSSAEAIQRDAEYSLRNQPHNGEGPFVRRTAPTAAVDLTRLENPLARLSDGAAASAMQLPFSALHPQGPTYHSPSYGPVDYNDPIVATPSATAAMQGAQGIWAANPRYPAAPLQYPPLHLNATPTPGMPTHPSPEGRQMNPLAFLTPSTAPSPLPPMSSPIGVADDAVSVVSRVSSAAYALRRQRIASGSPPRY